MGSDHKFPDKQHIKSKTCEHICPLLSLSHCPVTLFSTWKDTVNLHQPQMFYFLLFSFLLCLEKSHHNLGSQVLHPAPADKT